MGTKTRLQTTASERTIDWQTKIVSDGSTVTTMVAGRGYFIDNSSAAGIVKLPASANHGDIIAIKDYAGNFATNNLIIQRNSHNIQGIADDGLLKTDRASVQLVYSDDGTKGWIYTNESNVGDLQNKGYISASGGTETTSGDYKIHTFTGDGNFTVSTAGFGGDEYSQVSYVVVAGGAGGGRGATDSGNAGGGGGAGGYREGKQASDPYTASPLATTGHAVSVQTYPVTVGAGGPASPWPQPSNTNNPSAALNGSNSVFSSFTATGGGGGGNRSNPTPQGGTTGGSGGGSVGGNAGGAGNTPPVSPPQGNPGGTTTAPSQNSGSGGGGATAAGSGTPPGASETGGAGGAGATSSINGTPTARAGGGGGGGSTNNGSAPGPGAGGAGGSGGGGSGANDDTSNAAAGTANTGGGGGGGSGSDPGGPSAAGGKGIVIIRYKYQN